MLAPVSPSVQFHNGRALVFALDIIPSQPSHAILLMWQTLVSPYFIARHADDPVPDQGKSAVHLSALTIAISFAQTFRNEIKSIRL
jgi:hypothetical protein